MTSTASALATTTPAADQTATSTGKPPRIPKRVRHACDLIASGTVTTITAAAERVKLSREHLSRMLSKPHVQVFIARKSRENISAGVLRASRRLVELVDANSEHVAAQVSERILQSEGILKTDQRAIAVSLDVKAGFILDLREGESVLTAHQQTIEAKPLIEQTSVSQPASDDD